MALLPARPRKALMCVSSNFPPKAGSFAEPRARMSATTCASNSLRWTSRKGLSILIVIENTRELAPTAVLPPDRIGMEYSPHRCPSLNIQSVQTLNKRVAGFLGPRDQIKRARHRINNRRSHDAYVPAEIIVIAPARANRAHVSVRRRHNI